MDERCASSSVFDRKRTPPEPSFANRVAKHCDGNSNRCTQNRPFQLHSLIDSHLRCDCLSKRHQNTPTDPETLPSLPVANVLPAIVEAIAAQKSVVIKAPPGSGKTTLVPPAILNADLGSGKTLLIQPRRLAVRSAASRLAQIMGCPVGGTVGYQVRFDNQASDTTRLTAMTTGILLRRLQADPFLEDIDCVILDEFHERSAEMDLALGMLHRIRSTVRPELSLIVMSATFDTRPIIDFLSTAGPSVGISSEGKAYDVEIKYVGDSMFRTDLDSRVCETVQLAAKESTGDILVFLPGVSEIHRCQNALEQRFDRERLDVRILHGSLNTKQQDAALAPSDSRRVVLATNVAETSITIEGITCVIDSGLSKVMEYDRRNGLPTLQIQPISQASAEQRSGRAGRTQPGIAYRLWPANTHHVRAEYDSPEIERCDLSGPLLTLASWDERDPEQFPWLTQPPGTSIDQAETLLHRIGATNSDGRLNSVGYQMTSLPLSPRLARFMLAAVDYDCAQPASIIAALLTERDPFRSSSMDLFDRSARVISWIKEGKPSSDPLAHSMRVIAKVATQIQQSVDTGNGSLRRDALSRSLLTAFPDRVARRREHDPKRGVLAEGRGVIFSGQRASNQPTSNQRSLDQSEFQLCLDIDDAGSEAKVRMSVPIDRSWLDSSLIQQRHESFFDQQRFAVATRMRTWYLNLLLNESNASCVPSNDVASILFDAAKPNMDKLVSEQPRQLAQFIERLEFISSSIHEGSAGAMDSNLLESVLRDLCQSATSFADLRKSDWLTMLKARFDYAELQRIDKLAPTELTLPSGNRAKLNYESGQPWIEARIQEVFGWLKTPRIAGGRVPIRLHLLGPNYRAQQITEDLANFWSTTYSQVRKDLRGRYPKHHWPEDPTNAKATRNGLKPRS